MRLLSRETGQPRALAPPLAAQRWKMAARLWRAKKLLVITKSSFKDNTLDPYLLYVDPYFVVLKPSLKPSPKTRTVINRDHVNWGLNWSPLPINIRWSHLTPVGFCLSSSQRGGKSCCDYFHGAILWVVQFRQCALGSRTRTQARNRSQPWKTQTATAQRYGYYVLYRRRLQQSCWVLLAVFTNQRKVSRFQRLRR